MARRFVRAGVLASLLLLVLVSVVAAQEVCTWREYDASGQLLRVVTGLCASPCCKAAYCSEPVPVGEATAVSVDGRQSTPTPSPELRQSWEEHQDGLRQEQIRESNLRGVGNLFLTVGLIGLIICFYWRGRQKKAAEDAAWDGFDRKLRTEATEAAEALIAELEQRSGSLAAEEVRRANNQANTPKQIRRARALWSRVAG